MKRDRHGKAKILSHEEIQLLFTNGLLTTRDRTIFAVALFTTARINEVVTLLSADIYKKGQVRSHLTIRKDNTKGKLATRSIPIIEDLQSLLIEYLPEAGEMVMLGKLIFPVLTISAHWVQMLQVEELFRIYLLRGV